MELRIGEKIKALRLASDLTQEELANRARLSKGFISQLENDQTSIQIDSLSDILEALGVGLSEFFADDQGTKEVFAPSDRVAVEGTGAEKFELLVPGSTNSLMDPIYVQLRPGESLEKRTPHPGEQFGYVIQGTATLSIDNKALSVARNHCFYFTSDREHQISNNSGRLVTLLWVTTPPQM
ncbi:MAG: XRE family transcriptional regulator [candidate division Zixibacteria bacterium]|nr:XRE family transcriptional regulator [candidate division Zixibacteria bacterium]MDH3937000.1 XRE family transcriptional regulator [candidate division Zixibacteria bacterium]MDH4034581.1 XRE family transcriptional regulator [candidate division Zixibacteria bacterium]